MSTEIHNVPEQVARPALVELDGKNLYPDEIKYAGKNRYFIYRDTDITETEATEIIQKWKQTIQQ